MRHGRKRSAVLRTTLIGVAVCALSTLAAGSLNAQNYPAQVIRIVVPTAPSTPPDIISRVIANELQNANGWRCSIQS